MNIQSYIQEGGAPNSQAPTRAFTAVISLIQHTFLRCIKVFPYGDSYQWSHQGLCGWMYKKNPKTQKTQPPKKTKQKPVWPKLFKA